MKDQLTDRKIKNVDNYVLYATNSVVTSTVAETQSMADKKYNELLQNAPYDPSSDRFGNLESTMDEAIENAHNVPLRKLLEAELNERLTAYPNGDRGTGERLARDYPELTGEDMRVLKEQKGQDKKMMEEQQAQSEKHKTDLKQIYAQAKINQQQAFANVGNLQNYVQMIGSYQQTYKQHFDLSQANVLAAQGLTGKQIVTSSALERNYISYKGKQQIGAVNVTHKGENGKFNENIESVFDLNEFDKKARAKMATATINDYKRYTYEEKKQVKDNYYQQEGNHRSFKATGDPQKDLQVAKNCTADYLANIQLGLWKRTAKPNYDKLKFDPAKLAIKDQFEFMDDSIKASRIITTGIQKQIDDNHQARAKARAQSVRQERSVQATPTFGAASERVSRIGLQKQETGLQR